MAAARRRHAGRFGAGGAGELPRYTFDRTDLAGRLELAINVANGNAIVHESDVEYTDPNASYALERYFNSRAVASSPTGPKWTSGAGSDVGLVFMANGDIGYEASTGIQTAFARNADGTYAIIDGVDQELVKNTDGTYTVTDATGTVRSFDVNGFLTRQSDTLGEDSTSVGSDITFAYSDGLLDSQTDSMDRTSRFTYDAAGRLASMKDASGATHTYGRDAAGNLALYTAPDGKTTTMTYSDGTLTTIKDIAGRTTSLTYDGQGRVSAVVDGSPSDSTAPRTSYVYEAAALPCARRCGRAGRAGSRPCSAGGRSRGARSRRRGSRARTAS